MTTSRTKPFLSFVLISIIFALAACSGDDAGVASQGSSSSSSGAIVDSTPAPLVFNEQADAGFGEWLESNPVTLSGFDGELVLSVSGGEYSLDGESYTSETAMVASGAQLTLRHQTATTLGTQTQTLVSLGALEGVFTSQTAVSNQAPSWNTPDDIGLVRKISTSADGAVFVTSTDMDGDGDMDVLSASWFDDSIVWYENDGAAVPSFREHIVTAAANGAHSVYAADMDGDGDMDVLSASWFDNTIAWYENDGAAAASFSAHVVADSAIGTWSVYATDVDGDGDLDVLSTSFSRDGSIAWYENDGAALPSFSTHRVPTAVSNATSIYGADMDGDGDIDLLSAFELRDTVAWYENDGAAVPSFSEHVISTVAGGAYSVYAADMDGDGDMDVLSASDNDDTIAWYENDGAAVPSFSEHVISTAADGARSVHAADMDGDGDMDVLSASWFDDTIAWYENDGAAAPNFREHVVSVAADGARSVHAADLDGDGGMELLSASYEDDTIAWYPIVQSRYSALAGTQSTFNESATDVDGNTLSYEIFTVSSPSLDGAYFSIDSLTGQLTFSNAPATVSPGDSNTDNVYEVWISVSDGYATSRRKVWVTVYDDDEDDDNDGVSDVEDALPLDPSEQVDTDSDGIGNNRDTDDDNDGAADTDDNAPLDAASYSQPVWGNLDELTDVREVTDQADGARTAFAADIDGDGDMDVLSESSFGGAISWYENDGASAPSFTEHVVITSGDDIWSVYAADIDGDGDLDLLSASRNHDTVAWYENDGAAVPSFIEHEVTAVADGAVSVYAADVDDDGDMDVLSASENDDTIAWYENDGAATPSFSRHIVSNEEDGASSVYAVDMDGDGDMDLLSAAPEDDTIAWYENDGAAVPNFSRHLVTTIADGVRSVYAADVDGDGEMDVLSAETIGQTIAWYENDGAAVPHFSGHKVASIAEHADVWSIHAADMDGDGDMDVLAVSLFGSTIDWYENDGTDNPRFAKHILADATDGTSSIYAADMDGDGDKDVLSVSLYSGNIAWHPIEQRRYQIVAGSVTSFDESATDLDGNTLSYSINDGISPTSDASYFSIDSSTGLLTFGSAPAVTSPGDSNGDNVYEIWIAVNDGYSTLYRKVAVQVTD